MVADFELVVVMNDFQRFFEPAAAPTTFVGIGEGDYVPCESVFVHSPKFAEVSESESHVPGFQARASHEYSDGASVRFLVYLECQRAGLVLHTLRDFTCEEFASQTSQPYSSSGRTYANQTSSFALTEILWLTSSFVSSAVLSLDFLIMYLMWWPQSKF